MIRSSACPPWPSDQPGTAGERGDYDAELHHVQGHDQQPSPRGETGPLTRALRPERTLALLQLLDSRSPVQRLLTQPPRSALGGKLNVVRALGSGHGGIGEFPDDRDWQRTTPSCQLGGPLRGAVPDATSSQHRPTHCAAAQWPGFMLKLALAPVASSTMKSSLSRQSKATA